MEKSSGRPLFVVAQCAGQGTAFVGELERNAARLAAARLAVLEELDAASTAALAGTLGESDGAEAVGRAALSAPLIYSLSLAQLQQQVVRSSARTLLGSLDAVVGHSQGFAAALSAAAAASEGGATLDAIARCAMLRRPCLLRSGSNSRTHHP